MHGLGGTPHTGEQDFVFAQLGLVAGVGDWPVLELAVAVARAEVFVEVRVVDAFVASVCRGADSAERGAGLAVVSVEELELTTTLGLNKIIIFVLLVWQVIILLQLSCLSGKG